MMVYLSLTDSRLLSSSSSMTSHFDISSRLSAASAISWRKCEITVVVAAIAVVVVVGVSLAVRTPVVV